MCQGSFFFFPLSFYLWGLLGWRCRSIVWSRRGGRISGGGVVHVVDLERCYWAPLHLKWWSPPHLGDGGSLDLTIAFSPWGQGYTQLHMDINLSLSSLPLPPRITEGQDPGHAGAEAGTSSRSRCGHGDTAVAHATCCRRGWWGHKESKSSR